MTIQSITARRIWDSRGRPTVEVEVANADGASGIGIAPRGRLARHAARPWSCATAANASAGWTCSRPCAASNARSHRALLGRDAADQAGIDATLIALDGTPHKSRLGGNALVATSLAVLHAAAAQARQPLWRYLAGGDARCSCRCRRSRSSAAARTRAPRGRAGLHGDRHRRRLLRAGAGDDGRGLPRRRRDHGRARALAGVADEGGWWPNFTRNEEALDTLVHAIEQAGYIPGRGRRDRPGHRRLGIRPRRPLPAGAGPAGAGQRRPVRAACCTGSSLPHRLDRGSAGGGRRSGLAAFTAGGRRPRAGGRRRLPRDQRRTGARRGPWAPATACSSSPTRRDGHRDEGGSRCRARTRLRDHRVRPLGRDRGRGHRAPGHRLERGPAQGGFVRALRAHGQVERGHPAGDQDTGAGRFRRARGPGRRQRRPR